MIEFRNVIKRYDQRCILSNISFSVPKGKTLVLLGLSGCGKTTTLKMINRLVEPTSGEIFIQGKPLSEWDLISLRRGMGYVIQQTGLFPHMTIRDNIDIILRLQKRPTKFITQRTLELMDLVGLETELLDRYPAQLSGGQQQRVGVARAFATDPEIILMDEPFSALDPITRADLQDSLISLQAQLQKNIVFVTHDMSEALKIADQICIMDQGEIVQFDTAENILKNPSNDFVSKFIGRNRIWDSPEYITVADVMIEHPVTCHTTMSLVECREIMRSRDVDSMLVIDRHSRKLLGVLSARHLQGQIDWYQKAGAVMKTEVFTVNPGDLILDMLKEVQARRGSNIPVVDADNRLMGLLTKSSLVTTLSQPYFEHDEEEAL